MKIKCGRNEFDLNDKDVIFDNGACFQITTRRVGGGWNESSPIVAKTLAKKLIKNGDLILIKENLEYVTGKGKEMWHRYYKVKG